jgi:hypothetical protein
MIYYNADPQGSGAAQAATPPDMAAIQRALQTLDYTARRLMPEVYGKGKPQADAAADTLRRALAQPAPAFGTKSQLEAALAKAGYPAAASAQPEALDLREIEALTDNYDAAQFMADKWPLDVPQRPEAGLRAIAAQIGLRPDLTPEETRAAFAKWLAEAANAYTINLADDLKAAARAPQGSGASFGKQLGGTLKKLVTRPADYFQSLGEEIGKGLAATGKALLKARQIGPLGTYFLDPLGITLQATVLSQLGRILQTHSIKDFDVPAVGYALASNFAATGQALITAAPFTGPFAPLFTVCGAITVAMGKGLRAILDAQGAQAHDVTGQAQYEQAAAIEAMPDEIDAETVTSGTAQDGSPRHWYWQHYTKSGWKAVAEWNEPAQAWSYFQQAGV